MKEKSKSFNCPNCGLPLSFETVSELPQFRNEKDLAELYITVCPKCGKKLEEAIFLTKDGHSCRSYDTLLD